MNARLAHNFHPHCGCSQCDAVEEMEIAADEAAEALFGSDSILSEALGEITEDDMKKMAAAILVGDDAEAGALLRKSVGIYITDLIESRMDERGCTRKEAVDRLLEVHL